MGQIVFTAQTTDIESDEFVIAGPAIVEVLISGVLDGADVRTLVLDEHNNAAPVKPLSWRSSLGDTLAAPPLADGGVDIINTNRIKFDIVGAGAGTNINLSFIAKEA